MDQRTRALFAAGIALVGAGILFGMVVYPFDYGPVEGALVAAAFVALALVETVLDNAEL